MTTETEETRPLLDEEEGTRPRKPTPLPMGQIAILMVLQLAEPITSHCIYPFINQVSSMYARSCLSDPWLMTRAAHS